MQAATKKQTIPYQEEEQVTTRSNHNLIDPRSMPIPPFCVSCTQEYHNNKKVRASHKKLVVYNIAFNQALMDFLHLVLDRNHRSIQLEQCEGLIEFCHQGQLVVPCFSLEAKKNEIQNKKLGKLSRSGQRQEKVHLILGSTRLFFFFFF